VAGDANEYSLCPTKIDVLMIETGNFMTNTISRGAGTNELYLTFTYDGEFPDLQESTDAGEQQKHQLTQQAATVVHRTINEIRSMVREGKK